MSDTNRIRTSIVEGLYVLYVPALIGSGILALGPEGVVYACLALTGWISVLVIKNGGDLVWTFLGVLLFVFVGSLCLMSPKLNNRHYSPTMVWRTQCHRNVKQLGLALHLYHQDHGSFPPAVTRDQNGHPMHSWRVLILPYLGEQELFEAYDFNEPWDGPNNRKLISEMPSVFACPSSHAQRRGDEWYTSYVAVVGEDTMWPDSGARSVDDVTDELDATVQLVECDLGRIPWTEPRDPELHEALEILPSTQPFGHWSPMSFEEDQSWDQTVLRADGGTTSLEHGLTAEDWRTRLVINDGGPDSLREATVRGFSKRRERAGITRRTIERWLFIALVVLPAPFVFRRRKAQTTKPQSAQS